MYSIRGPAMSFRRLNSRFPKETGEIPYYVCMYALLFRFWSSIILAFVSVLRTVCITNVWGYTEIFPLLKTRSLNQGTISLNN